MAGSEFLRCGVEKLRLRVGIGISLHIANSVMVAGQLGKPLATNSGETPFIGDDLAEMVRAL
jgi:hypothetical protein